MHNSFHMVDNHEIRQNFFWSERLVDWGKEIPITLCAACRSKMEEKTGALDLRIRGDLYMVKNLVYEECGVCGERTVSPEVSQMVYEKIKIKQYYVP